MNAKTVFMGYTRGDIVNFAVAIILALVIVPMVVKTDYWYSSILIPWLCLALAAVGQQIVMGYAGQLALGAAGFMAAGAFACFNLILRVPYIPFPLALVFSGLIAAAFVVAHGEDVPAKFNKPHFFIKIYSCWILFPNTQPYP